jgi:hypothetical protein
MEVLFRYFSGGTDEDCENVNSGKSVARARFEMNTSRKLYHLR